METPFGSNFDGQRTHILKLNKSLYGLKQSRTPSEKALEKKRQAQEEKFTSNPSSFNKLTGFLP